MIMWAMGGVHAAYLCMLVHHLVASRVALIPCSPACLVHFVLLHATFHAAMPACSGQHACMAALERLHGIYLHGCKASHLAHAPVQELQARPQDAQGSE